MTQLIKDVFITILRFLRSGSSLKNISAPTFLFASIVRDRTIRPQRRPAAMGRIEHRLRSDDVQVGILLAGETCKGQIFGSGRRPHGDRLSIEESAIGGNFRRHGSFHRDYRPFHRRWPACLCESDRTRVLVAYVDPRVIGSWAPETGCQPRPSAPPPAHSARAYRSRFRRRLPQPLRYDGASADLSPSHGLQGIRTRRVMCPLLSQYVLLLARKGSSGAGCMLPSTSNARDVIWCSPDDGVPQSNVQNRHA